MRRTSRLLMIAGMLLSASVALTACDAGAQRADESRQPTPSQTTSTSPLSTDPSIVTPEASTTASEFIGTWGVVVPGTGQGEPYIIIDADGTAGGSDGCNGFGDLNWTFTGASIVFSDGVQTLVGCPSVDQWLNQRSTAIVRGDSLTFFDEAGVEIGTLSRTG
ncbi:hypothetical protein [Agromyces sp. PvR057]|uniref:META domain-containing protein n=1 Tax=Agromyces sp. PvR057 TaxID=3156403 RepID=UPI00339687E9